MKSFVREGQRFHFLDALRGVAALAVAAFHMYAFSAVAPHLALVEPQWVDAVLKHGYLGVDVFFVISGIAIATSISGAQITGRYIGYFALRRSIRLDPPYWATLALATTILAIVHRPPPVGSVLAHIVYLQVFMGQRNIVSVFWTLTYEIQFYLVLVLAVMLAQRMGRKVGWSLAIIPFLVSLFVSVAGTSTPGLFILWWYAFAAGVATFGMLTGRLQFGLWLVVLGSIAALEPFTGGMNHICVSLTALIIGLMGRSGALVRCTGGTLLQWLGRRSYSLYLIHFLGSAVAKGLSSRVESAGQALLLFLASLTVAIGAAEILYRTIEAPMHRLSRGIGAGTEARERADLSSITPEATSGGLMAHLRADPLERQLLATSAVRNDPRVAELGQAS